MRVCVKDGGISGSIKSIASKSAAHRILICSAFADKPTHIFIEELSSDILATMDCLKALGAKIDRVSDGLEVYPISKVPSEAVLDCRESGSTLRFMLPIAGALGTAAEFVMAARLPDRPLSPLWEEMEAHGCSFERPCRERLKLSGKLGAGDYRLAANVSSQFITGLLFALPLVDGESRIILEGNLESAGYIDLTRDIQSKFGIETKFDGDEINFISGNYKSPEKIEVEGDWSNGAFWLCAGAVGKRAVECYGLDINSTQGDRRIVDILKDFGANVAVEHGKVRVSPGELYGINLDASEIPDLVPIISVVACAAKGKTIIKGAARLRIKECDRLSAMTEVLNSLGADVKELPDGLEINGGGILNGGKVKKYSDHRIPMTAAIASSICSGEVVIDGAEDVSKSYPTFWDDFVKLGACIKMGAAD